MKSAVDALAPLAKGHDLVVTHGNGPQVDLLALENARDPDLSHPCPFDVLGAQTQGMIGCWLLHALGNALRDRSVVSLTTQTLVSADDPVFKSPTKLVGPVYTEDVAQTLARRWNWEIRRDRPGCDESWRAPSLRRCWGVTRSVRSWLDVRW